MKKILYTILISCFMCMAFADYDFSGAIQNTSMPTDDEIRAIISQFNFTKEQQDAIFKDTKKKLQIMYSGKNAAQTNAELNKYVNEVQQGTFDEVIDPSSKKELLEGVSTLPQINSSKVQTQASETTNKKGFQSKGFQSKKPFSVKRSN